MKKNIDFCCLRLLIDLLSLHTDINVPTENNKVKYFEQKLNCWHLESHWQKKQDPELDLDPSLRPNVTVTRYRY
jgi:hypothetical protein